MKCLSGLPFYYYQNLVLLICGLSSWAPFLRQYPFFKLKIFYVYLSRMFINLNSSSATTSVW